VFYVAIVRDTYKFELWVGFRFRFLVACIWSGSCLSTKLGPHPEDADDTESSNKYALIFRQILVRARSVPEKFQNMSNPRDCANPYPASRAKLQIASTHVLLFEINMGMTRHLNIKRHPRVRAALGESNVDP
jgi:hypothetical protein